MTQHTLSRNSDYCTFLGAKRLANHIRTYWHQRGAYVLVTIERADKESVPSQGERALYCVRSDLKGGWPPKEAWL